MPRRSRRLGLRMNAGQAPICVLGHHELDYPRNQALQALLRDLGHPLIECHSRAPFPLRHLSLAAQLLSAPREARVVYVTEGGHRLVPIVRAVAALTGRRVLFDPFLSRYSTRVDDRGWYEPGSLRARIAHFQDWSSTHAADFLLFDTQEHRDYFFERYGLNKPSAVLPVGVPEQLFMQRPLPNETPMRVLFYGTYIPLQGVETIVDAIAKLGEHSGIRFTLVGEGQTRSDVSARAQRLKLSPPLLAFENQVPLAAIVELLTQSHVSLGIFGTTKKASRVVPNKVVQAAAVGRPIITADTPAVRRYFVHEESAYLVPPGDARALAAALRRLAEEPLLRERIAGGARRVFEARFSSTVAREVLRGVLTQVR